MAAEEEKNLVEILEDNMVINITKYISYVQSPSCDAIATFAGTTGDTFEGREVLELRYEAYVPMALRCLKSICALCKIILETQCVRCNLICSSRGDALDACKFIIDEVKASVPIWKKEVYTNGEVWKENSEFLERRDELGNGKSCCRRKVIAEEGPKKKV